MKILALDTSSLACSAALAIDGRLTAEVLLNSGLTHSQTLMPAVEALLEREGLTPADIDLFAAVAGPGSFTGVRIGVCAVKGLCASSGQQCARVDALEAIAEGASYEGLICPILDARRGQLYTALFERRGGALRRVREDEALSLAEWLGTLPKDETVFFSGDGLNVHEALIRDCMGERALIAPAHIRVLRASSACLIAERDESIRMDASQLTPVYLRLSQAERERNERMTRARI